MSRKSIFLANRHFPARGATPAADLRVAADQPAGQAEGRPRRLPPGFACRILLLCGPRLPLKSVSPRTRGRRSDRLKLPSSETTRRRRGWVPPLRNRKFADSPLEGGGFELSVPRCARDPRELESRELLDADPANPLGDAFLEVPRRTESSQTHRWREVDSNY
jgi:hypothetical protein